MQRTFALDTRSGLAFSAVVCCLAFCSPAWGQVDTGDNPPANPLAGVDIVKIEEDWSIDIADPDPAADCPQIVTVFGPADPASGTHAIFELNHGTLPNYGEGGMQLQVWYGQYLIGYRTQFAPAELNCAIERLTFTTVTRVRDQVLKLYVKNGNSMTWGNFGGGESLRVEMSTWRSNLNDWDSQSSIAHSRVAYGANRVNAYLRTAVRYYIAGSDGGTQLHYTDDTDTYVHRLVEAHYAPDPIAQ